MMWSTSTFLNSKNGYLGVFLVFIVMFPYEDLSFMFCTFSFGAATVVREICITTSLSVWISSILHRISVYQKLYEQQV
jgi:hypothetical protein